MAKATDTCNSILALIFNATAWADIAENDSSGPLTDLYISLHETDPGVGGSQLTGETTYGSYIRVAVPRSTVLGWHAPAAGSTHNEALIQFAECTGLGTFNIQYVAIGTDSAGAGRVLYAGLLTSPRSISAGIQPQFSASALVVTET